MYLEPWITCVACCVEKPEAVHSELASPGSLLYSHHSVFSIHYSLALRSWTGLCESEHVDALRGDAVLPCLFGDENEYSVT